MLLLSMVIKSTEVVVDVFGVFITGTGALYYIKSQSILNYKLWQSVLVAHTLHFTVQH